MKYNPVVYVYGKYQLNTLKLSEDLFSIEMLDISEKYPLQWSCNMTSEEKLQTVNQFEKSGYLIPDKVKALREEYQRLKNQV